MTLRRSAPSAPLASPFGTATGDASYTADIPGNAGIALFRASAAAGLTLANRLDAAGSTSEANALYKEGNGYPPISSLALEYSFVRDECGKGGAPNLFGPCPVITPKDTNDNAADFFFVDTDGMNVGAGQRLGAPRGSRPRCSTCRSPRPRRRTASATCPPTRPTTRPSARSKSAAASSTRRGRR